MENTPSVAPVERIVSPIVSPFYERDGITIYCGDCRQVLPFLDRFDLLLTDPPYGIDEKISTGGGPHTKNRTKFHNAYRSGPRWDKERPDKETFRLMFGAANNQIVCGANYFVEMLPVSRGWVFWDKQGEGMSSVNNELIFTSLDRSIMTFSRCHGLDKGFMNRAGQWHPTQKPLALMKWCIGLVPHAKSVLDPFMGSGTTLVAAKLLGLRAVGIEINREYCEAAVERLRQGVLCFDSEG